LTCWHNFTTKTIEIIKNNNNKNLTHNISKNTSKSHHNHNSITTFILLNSYRKKSLLYMLSLTHKNSIMKSWKNKFPINLSSLTSSKRIIINIKKIRYRLQRLKIEINVLLKSLIKLLKISNILKKKRHFLKKRQRKIPKLKNPAFQIILKTSPLPFLIRHYQHKISKEPPIVQIYIKRKCYNLKKIISLSIKTENSGLILMISCLFSCHLKKSETITFLMILFFNFLVY